MLDIQHIRACSFDCYGTLIDWQSGILAALSPRLAARGPAMADTEIIRRFAEYEAAAEAGPYRPYRQVLEEVAGRFFGSDCSVQDRECLWRSIAEWEAFADTPAGLRALKQRFRLAVVSNIDDDLFQWTRPKLGVELDELITAQQVRSYKPGRSHFEALLSRLKLEPRQILHIAESRRHDIEPAGVMGFPTVWVQRQLTGPSASGAPGAEGVTSAGRDPLLTVSSLAGLVHRIADRA